MRRIWKSILTKQVRRFIRLFAAMTFGLFAASADAQPHPDRPLFAWPKDTHPPEFAFNPTTPEKVALGRKLFFDPRLSHSNQISCATCHQPDYVWTDTEARNRNHKGEVIQRRTQSLLGVAWVPRLGWTGRVDALEGFALAPIARENEMGQDLDLLVAELQRDTAYSEAFERAFGDSEVQISGIAHSLAAFMRTIVPEKSAFHRWLDGDVSAMTSAQVDGYRIFKDVGCAACHGGWRLTDDDFHDIGLPAGKDIGRAEVAPQSPLTKYAFRTPSLLRVSQRPPYMHDGSLPTLADVVDHYADGIRHRRSLSPQLNRITLGDKEKLMLLEFLKAL